MYDHVISSNRPWYVLEYNSKRSGAKSWHIEYCWPSGDLDVTPVQCMSTRVYRAAEGGERACHVNVYIQTWRRFSNVSNGRIWKRGLQSAMNLLYRVWMWFTTRCTCELSMRKHCIAINGVTNLGTGGHVWILTFTYIACPLTAFGVSIRPWCPLLPSVSLHMSTNFTYMYMCNTMNMWFSGSPDFNTCGAQCMQ